MIYDDSSHDDSQHMTWRLHSWPWRMEWKLQIILEVENIRNVSMLEAVKRVCGLSDPVLPRHRWPTFVLMIGRLNQTKDKASTLTELGKTHESSVSILDSVEKFGNFLLSFLLSSLFVSGVWVCMKCIVNMTAHFIGRTTNSHVQSPILKPWDSE